MRTVALSLALISSLVASTFANCGQLETKVLKDYPPSGGNPKGTAVYDTILVNHGGIGKPAPAGTDIEMGMGPCTCRSVWNGNGSYREGWMKVVMGPNPGWSFGYVCEYPQSAKATDCIPTVIMVNGNRCCHQVPRSGSLSSEMMTNNGKVVFNNHVNDFPYVGNKNAALAGTEISFTTGACKCTGINGFFRFFENDAIVKLSNDGWTFWLECTVPSGVDPKSCTPRAIQINGCPVGQQAIDAVPSKPQCLGEINGNIVIQPESHPVFGAWTKGSSNGEGYIEWSGANSFQTPRDVLEYEFVVSQPGKYKIDLFTSRKAAGQAWDQSNDAFVEVNHGSFKKLFTAMFVNGQAVYNYWMWSTAYDANHVFSLAVEDLHLGKNRLLIGGRSQYFRIGIVVLTKLGSTKTTNFAETVVSSEHCSQ